MSDWHSDVYQPGQNTRRWGWRGVRADILKRDHYRCARCERKNTQAQLTVHHIVPRDEGGSDLPDNLITLCSKCHDFVEADELRTVAAIVGSYDKPLPPMQFFQPKRVISDDWHTWVYGAGRDPQMDRAEKPPESKNGQIGAICNVFDLPDMMGVAATL